MMHHFQQFWQSPMPTDDSLGRFMIEIIKDQTRKKRDIDSSYSLVAQRKASAARITCNGGDFHPLIFVELYRLAA
jgi:hypothetical protein